MGHLERGLECRIPILLEGEAGTGKSVYARRLHQSSSLRGDPFVLVPVSCLKEELIESELFGHKKGAFTGSIECKKGLVALSKGGVLFFDEIGELGFSLQGRLLHLLEERIYYSIGCEREKKVESSFIFATNRNLEEMVREGSFREDLYYRINGLRKKMTPLRKIKNLKNLLIEEWENQGRRVNSQMVMPKMMFERLYQYHFVGNYREMKNIMASAHLMLEDRWSPQAIIESLLDNNKNGNNFEGGTYRSALEKFEKKYFREELEKRGGRINRTSKEIEVSKTTLIAKAKKYGINTWHLKSINNREAIGYPLAN